MREKWAEQPGQLMPATEALINVAEPLASSAVMIDAGQQMTEMERVDGAAGIGTPQTEALATVRRWQSDPRLDSPSRQRAGALAWKLQPNGWDEV